MHPTANLSKTVEFADCSHFAFCILHFHHPTTPPLHSASFQSRPIKPNQGVFEPVCSLTKTQIAIVLSPGHADISPLLQMDTEYKIIGGDGAEYGPASLDELKSWIGDGRVAGSTQVWRNDLALWTPAARYAELQQALARLPASMSPAARNQALRAAGFWPRLAAYLLDRVLLAMLFGMICQWKHWEIPALPAVLDDQTFRQFLEQYRLYANLVLPYVFVLTVLYDVLLNGTFGATLGKMAVGAKIIAADGSPLGYSRSLLRSLAARFTEIMLFLGYLWIIVRSDKRGLHDLMAGTRVVLQR